MRLVCVVGIDGTGKTTHAKSLVKDLREHGIAVHYVWCRGVPKLFFPLLRLFKLLVFGQPIEKSVFEDIPASDPLKQRLLSITLVSRLWRTILVFDTFIQVLIGVWIPLRLGKMVVSDRYIFDQMVDVAVDYNFSKSQLQQWVKNPIYRIFPRPDLTFLFDVDAKMSYARKWDSHPIPDIALRRKIYAWLAQIVPMTVIDASENIDLVDSKVRSSVYERLELHEN